MLAATTTSIDAVYERVASTALRRPGSTYRLQMHHGFTFDEATAVVDYLADLGVSDVYLSPHLAARPGSPHGYDVFDHTRINPEIGDEAALRRLIDALAARGMGRVLDLVPNHMGVGGQNRFWLDVLELGPGAPSARFFDIDWHPVKDELDGRLLLPILEDQYGKVLEAGGLVVVRDNGSLHVRYGETRLPLDPKSYARVLERRSEQLSERFDPEDPHLLEYRSIWASAHHLPDRMATSLEHVEERIRERDVIQRRLSRLCAESPRCREFLDGNIADLQGTPGDPESFDALHRLLEEQVYRLAFWRVASEEINYRRFFDINDLAGLRTDDPRVFELVHAIAFRWVDDGGVTGLRIDHPDGLADPAGYFRALQEALFVHECLRNTPPGLTDAEIDQAARSFKARFREEIAANPVSAIARRFPVVAEKILTGSEELPSDWPIDGTVGYEYLNVLNGLFIEPTAADAIAAIHAEFTGDRRPFAEVLFQAKRLILRYSLASEVNTLARQLNRVSEADRRSRDFTLNELREAILETIAAFPVYRTYVQPNRPVSAADREYVKRAVRGANRRNHHLDPSLFQFLRDALLLELRVEAPAAERALVEQFVERFQQTTGPVQAKGLEDTAFYRQVKLASINEVGAEPGRFSNPPSAFHTLNHDRVRRWPGSFSATATHDAKRGEDARIRINALSESTEQWRTHLARWSSRNATKKTLVKGALCPDAQEEYLFYQTLLGAWPLGEDDGGVPSGLSERMAQYAVKAAREAKLNTSWIDPDPAYGEALAKFVAVVLEGSDSRLFLEDFLPFQRKLARIGVVHSLSQTLLKLASPGVADFFQGCELWDFRLVDPDNRTPVDYELRARLLDRIRVRLRVGEPRAEIARSLLENPNDGAIKLYLIMTLLEHRREHLDLYQIGRYEPLEVDGPRRDNVVAFARHRDDDGSVMALAPRLVGPLMGANAERMPLGSEAWGETRVLVDESAGPIPWRDLLTDRRFAPAGRDGRLTLDIADVFSVLPVALLVGEP
jgi:(1->4)-alpha-D-glucan 1-alpha-D-glucosylmutase